MSQKIKVDELVIDGVTYVPKDSVQKEFAGDLKIVILQRGWVMIGKFERSGNDCKLHNASVIRVWGTTKGLGQLALEGPQTGTKLDKCGLVEFDYLTTISVISCNPNKWDYV